MRPEVLEAFEAHVIAWMRWLNAEYMRAWQKNNRERVAASTKRWQMANAEQVNEKRRAWYHGNLERARESQRRYAEVNRHVRNKTQQARRARKLNATPGWAGEFDELVALEAADLANRREEATGFAWHVDHCIPLQAKTACGLHVGANLQVIPAALNIGKRERMRLTEPGEWIKWA